MGGVACNKTTKGINSVFMATCRAEMQITSMGLEILICRTRAVWYAPNLEFNFTTGQC